MSGQEIKSSLRKLEFPLCAQEALIKIGQLICGKVPSLKQMDLALDLMAEFIFCEVDKRGNKIGSLGPFKDLELIAILVEYLRGMKMESHRNTVFLSLFSGAALSLRATLLSKLISLAVGIPMPDVLVSASAWMQQIGTTSTNCTKLAEILIMDYFLLLTDGAARLNQLSSIAPSFVSNFLTAVSEIYFTEAKGILKYPPNSLLEAITIWIKRNYKLCIAAQQNPPVLPSGAIAMETTTPLAGLLKWTILAPIFNQNSDLYAKLHLALLNSLLEVPVVTPPTAVGAKLLTAPVGYICRFAMIMKTTARREDGGKVHLDNELLQLSLDRYAQAVQIALYRKCVYGNTNDLINQLCQLPQHRLLSIMIKHNQINK